MGNEGKKRTPEELKKLKKHAEAQRAYYQRMKNKVNRGDKKALEQFNKNVYSRHWAVVKKFLKEEINKEDIKRANTMLVNRLKELNKKA